MDLRKPVLEMLVAEENETLKKLQGSTVLMFSHWPDFLDDCSTFQIHGDLMDWFVDRAVPTRAEQDAVFKAVTNMFITNHVPDLICLCTCL